MSLVKQLRREVQALTKYAHQTFSDNRLAKNDQQHQSQHHNQQHQQHQQDTSAETNASAAIDLMPDFASWKQQQNIMHDTHRDHGNPGMH